MKKLTLNEQQLAYLEELGTLLFTIKECAILLEVSYGDLKDEIELPTTPISKAYCKGYLTTKIQIHKKLIDMGKRGSQSALTEILEQFKKL